MLPVVGISPGNSYFKDDELEHILTTLCSEHEKVIFFIPDIPAIQTYLGLGYTHKKAKQKALLKGNNIRNKVTDLAKRNNLPEGGYEFTDWKTIAETDIYKESKHAIDTLFETNTEFRKSALQTTQQVLVGQMEEGEEVEAAALIGVEYLLCEIAFLDVVNQYYGITNSTYFYHKNWPVYEDYLAGKFGTDVKENQFFEFIEHPKNTFTPLKTSFENAYRRLISTKSLRASFFPYIDTFITNESGYSGIFYDLIQAIAKRNDFYIEWKEIVGYGSAPQRLNGENIDIFCSGTWPTAHREKVCLLSDPVFWSDVYAWGKMEHTGSNMDTLDFRVSVKKKDVHEDYANEFFPNARKVYVHQMSDTYSVFDYVERGASDIAFGSEKLFEYYNKESTSKLVKLKKDPIKRVPNCFMFGKEESELVDFINKEITALKASGEIDAIIKLYRTSSWKPSE